MTGPAEWSQVIFISGVIMASVVIGAGFALWIMSELRKIDTESAKRTGAVKDEVAGIKLDMSSQANALEKVIGALRIALLEDMKQTRHTIYGRVDMIGAAFKEQHDDLEERTRKNEVDIAGLKPLRNGKHA